MKKTILIIIIFISSNYLNSQQREIFEKLYTLEGKWEFVSGKTFITESWERLNDTIMIGESFTIKERDTISSETMELVLAGNNIYFIPTVKNQNEGKPVTFTLISFEDEAVFENKKHDFPQRVIYSLSGKDILNARIEGEHKGEWKRINFNYKRVTKN